MTNNQPQHRKLADLKISKRILSVRLDERSQERIQGYAENVANLPPITIDRENNILDGIHRYYAHQLAGRDDINCIVESVTTDKDRYMLAVELNATHGAGLSAEELKHNAIELYKLGATDKEIAKALSRSKDSVYSYLKEVKEARM